MTAALLGEHLAAAAGGTGMGPLVDSGDFRMLVVWTEKRSERFPDSPTLLETGHRIVSESPYGIGGPKGFDPKVIQVPRDGFKNGMNEPARRAILKEPSRPIVYKNRKDYQAFAMQIIEERQALIKELGLGRKSSPPA